MNAIRPNRAASIMSLTLAILVPLLAGGMVFLLVRSHGQDLTLQRQAHAALQQSVNARYDDCLAGDVLRTALSLQVDESRRNDPLLYKLLPSLNTPEVRALVKHSRDEQVKAFKPRGAAGCRAYALRVAPPNSRSSYEVPG